MTPFFYRMNEFSNLLHTAVILYTLISMNESITQNKQRACHGSVVFLLHYYSIQCNFICIALFTIQYCHKAALQRALA